MKTQIFWEITSRQQAAAYLLTQGNIPGGGRGGKEISDFSKRTRLALSPCQHPTRWNPQLVTRGGQNDRSLYFQSLQSSVEVSNAWNIPSVRLYLGDQKFSEIDRDSVGGIKNL